MSYTAEFISVKPLIPKIGRWRLPNLRNVRLPKYNDAIGQNLSRLKAYSTITGKLPSNGRIARNMIPAIGKDLATNPVRTVQNNLPRLRRGRAAIRMTTGIRVPGRKGIGDYLKNTAVNTGSAIGAGAVNALVPGSGLVGAYAGSVLGSMGTRKLGGAFRDIYKAYKSPGSTFDNLRSLRAARSPIKANRDVLGDVASNAIGTFTPIGSLPFGSDIAGKLTPKRIGLPKISRPKPLQTIRKIAGIRSNLNARLQDRYRRI
jgi:hypothetical protein